MDVSPKLLQYADSIAGAISGKTDDEGEEVERIEPDSEEGSQIISSSEGKEEVQGQVIQLR